MLKRMVFALSVAALTFTAVAQAQENATLVLRSGERVSGQLVDLGGVGFTMNFIQEARPRGTYPSSADLRYVAERLDDEKSRAAPIAMVGLQLQLLRFSVFGQGSYMPAQDRFLLNNNETYFIETGVRWNIGSSIERPQ